PTAIFQSTPTVGLPFDVSICDSAARLTPEATASSSSDRLRALRRRRRLSPTRCAISTAPSSSPGGNGWERAAPRSGGRGGAFLGGGGGDIDAPTLSRTVHLAGIVMIAQSPVAQKMLLASAAIEVGVICSRAMIIAV